MILALVIQNPEWLKSIEAHILHFPKNHILVKEDIADKVDDQTQQIVVGVKICFFLTMSHQKFAEVDKRGTAFGKPSELRDWAEEPSKISAQDGDDSPRNLQHVDVCVFSWSRAP